MGVICAENLTFLAISYKNRQKCQKSDNMSRNYLPFSALLSNSTSQKWRDFGPICRAVLLNSLQQLLVFFSAPKSLDHFWIENFAPAVLALNISAIFSKKFSHLFPVFGPNLVNDVSETLVLLQFDKKRFLRVRSFKDKEGF